MGRTVAKRLTNLQVENLSEPGKYGDGDGLYLIVKGKATKSWQFRYTMHGTRKEMGLGSYDRTNTLKRARELAEDARKLLSEGIDPIAARRAPTVGPDVKAVPTFGEFGLSVIESWRQTWKNEKHAEQWVTTIHDYAKLIKNVPVNKVDTNLVLSVLTPIWNKLPDTAKRVRGRIKRILDAAKVAGHRSGENPAAWEGHLEYLLNKRKKLTRGHHKAVPWQDMPDFMKKLRTFGRGSMSSLALEFTILTVARTNETIGAPLAELDLFTALWTIPKERMKMDRDHRVPLTTRALEIAEEVSRLSNNPENMVFRGGSKKTGGLSNMAMTMCLRGTGYDATVHGFRSSFRDWVRDKTLFPGDVAEAALAHLTGDETERAYLRSDALEFRRELMQAWEDFLLGPPTAADFKFKPK